jgi:uncharacterized protein
MDFDFEWDPEKAEANERKHGVNFEEASTAMSSASSARVQRPDANGGRMQKPGGS